MLPFDDATCTTPEGIVCNRVSVLARLQGTNEPLRSDTVRTLQLFRIFIAHDI